MTANELIALLSRLSPEERELPVYAGWNSTDEPRPAGEPRIQVEAKPRYDAVGDLMGAKWIDL